MGDSPTAGGQEHAHRKDMHADSLATIFTICRCKADEIEMRRLVAICRADYKKRQITGCIFWTGTFFAYVLEGTTRQLGTTVALMGKSGRQMSPRVVLQDKLLLRRFSGPPLAFVPVSDFDDVVSAAYEGSGDTRAARVLLALLTEEYFGHVADSEASVVA